MRKVRKATGKKLKKNTLPFMTASSLVMLQ